MGSNRCEKVTSPTQFDGQIEHITFHNENTGYTVARLRLEGKREPITVVGNLLEPKEGEVLHVEGEWIFHPKHGRQFKILTSKTTVPSTVEGVRRYLGSGLIHGIGPKMADRIVARFGRETLSIIESSPEKLANVEGIGAKRIQMIQSAWQAQKGIRDLMVFLQEFGVGEVYAHRIFKRYGDRAIAVVQNNPYRLASDIFGIGFHKADTISATLGYANTAPERISAGVIFTLQRLSEEGHIYFPYASLVERCRDLLEVDGDVVREALGRLALKGDIVIEEFSDTPAVPPDTHKAVFLDQLHHFENRIAGYLTDLAIHKPARTNANVDEMLQWVQRHMGIRLARKQNHAVRQALTNKLMVITGGPGTGKTTILRAVVEIATRHGRRVKLAAPTGRAAKRMSQATGHSAMTIHRMLEFSPQKGGFQRNDTHPLSCDLLIVDEASMIDVRLMYHLLRALPVASGLILVGDIYQLPSVGPGNVLKDIIASERLPVVELTEIFRQAKSSRIVMNAHHIHQGRMPELKHPEPKASASDFYFIEQEEPEKVLDLILTLVTDRIPRRFPFDPMNDIQVLSPMHKGIVGAVNLNRELQNRLNPDAPEWERGGVTFRMGDKVMQIRNNYEKNVYNGDIGRVTRIDRRNQEMSVAYEGRTVSYGPVDMDEIVLAYTISVHKSQGSEFPVVIIPILTQHYVLLQRNLIYTAVTRGKELVVMVGTKKALAIGIRNDQTLHRFTRLKERLKHLI